MQPLLINANADFADPNGPDPRSQMRNVRHSMSATAFFSSTPRMRAHNVSALVSICGAGYRKLQASSLCSQISQAPRLPLQSINHQLSTSD
jgi:hypothetical protein